MAWIRDFKTYVGTGTSITSTEMPAHESGDRLVVLLGKDDAAGGAWSITSPAATYTVIGSASGNMNVQYSTISAAAFEYEATSSSEANVTATTTDNDEQTMMILSIADVASGASGIDTTNSDYQAFNAVYNHEFTTPPTPTGTETLQLYWHISDGARDPTQEPGLMTLPLPNSYRHQTACSYSYEETTTQIFNPTAHNVINTTQGILFAIIFNPVSTSTPERPPYVSNTSPPTTWINPLRGANTTSYFGGGNVDVSSTGSGDITSINGVTLTHQNMDSYAATGVDAIATCSGMRGITGGYNVHGCVWDLDGTPHSVDLTSKTFCVHVGYLDGSAFKAVGLVQDGGYLFGIRTPDGSGGNQYRIWNIGAQDSSPSPESRYACVIDPDTATYEWDEIGSGTLDVSQVDGLFLGYQRLDGAGGEGRCAMYEAHALNTITMLGGNASAPITLASFIEAIRAPRIKTITNQGGASDKQFFALHSMQIGDGTAETYFSESSANLQFGTSSSGTNLQFQAGANTLSITFYAVSGDTISFTNSTLSGVTAWDFDIHASSTSAGFTATSFDGVILINADITLRDVFTAAQGITFLDCPSITTNNADLSGGCTFDNTLLTITAEAGLIDVHNCEFKNRNGAGESAILITGNQSGTWSDPSLTVSNNTYDIEYTGTTNFTIESAATLTVNNSSSGVLTIDTPTFDLTLNSSESSTLLQIFTTATQTVLASATDSTLAYTHSSETVDVVAQKAGFLPQRQTGIALSGDVTVTFNLVSDPVYDSGHGLAYTTDASWSRTNNELTVPSFGPSVRGVHSLMIDSFISETALRNTAYNISMNGPNAMFLIDDAEADADSTIENMTAGGVRYVNTSGTTTAEWIGLESIGTIPGSNTGEFTSDGATTVTDARATGKFDEVVKVYGDVTHGNFDNRSTSDTILKYQINGYRESRVNIQDTYGISTLEPTHYIVAMEPVAIGASAGDPALTITITDHGASPVTWNSKDFAITITDNATPSSGEAILREINYNLAQDATYQGKDPFSWPEMAKEVVSGSTFETSRGYTEDAQAGTFKGVRVVKNDGTTPHPDFVRFQADDGTYYTPPTVAQLSAPNVTSGRVQVYNNTGATASAWASTTAYSLGDYILRSTGKGTELGDGVFFVCTTAGTSGGSEPAFDVAADGNTTADGTVTWTVRPVEFDNASTVGAYSTSWTDGQHFASGDTIRFRWIDSDEDEIDATGVATASGTTTFLNAPVDDTVYDGYGIDGSTVTEYSADFPNVEVDVTDPDNVFYIDRFYAWWKYNLTTEDGIRNFFGGVTAVDTSNITINNTIVDIFFDNTKASSARQGDNIVVQRSDGAYPQVAVTSGGGGLGFYYTGIGYSTSSGSGLDTTERNKLLGLYDYDPTSQNVEGSVTYQEAQRLTLAEAAGKVAVSGSTVTFRDQADSKDRITATVDSNGQRTSITTDSS